MNLQEAFHTTFDRDREAAINILEAQIQQLRGRHGSTYFIDATWNWVLQPAMRRLQVARSVSEAITLRDRLGQLKGELEEAVANSDESWMREINDKIEAEVHDPLADLLDDSDCDYDSNFITSESVAEPILRMETALDIVEGMLHYE